MGEAPVSRGYPPSVFTELPKLVERAGQSDAGSITAIYTVLVEGDDMSDPISDEIVSLLDGHIVLSRDLANASHYPAIDILKSLSRVMTSIVDDVHISSANKIRKLLSDYKEIEFLVKVGEYEKGTNSQADEALEKYEIINNFLKQTFSEAVTLEETIEALHGIANG
jgi:type III secretion protein N (ATPase)